MKNAYLLVPDLHYAEEKENRKNYFGEILDIIQGLITLADKYRNDGCNVALILLGDVFDKSMVNSDEAMRGVDILRFLVSQFDSAYSVVGNHEETYISNNPFWYLVSQIDDDELAKLLRGIQPKSIHPCLQIPAIVTDGNVVFYFNHYGVPPKVPEVVGTRIGLFHQNVGSNDICKMWGTFDDVEEASYIQAYNYCYFGHMHMAYGKYQLNEQGTCICEWLGSCGRTNILEVENAPLEVNIPAVLVKDGELLSIEDNKLKRQSADECIDYDKVNLMRTTAEQVKAVQAATPVGLMSTSLLASVKEAAELAGLGVLVDMLLGSYDSLRSQYKQGLRQVIEHSVESLEPEEEERR